MFHTVSLDPIEFKSNPELDPRPLVDWHTREDGSPVNRFLLKPRDHNSFFQGAHYDASRDSLRSRLNLGIPLQKVNLGITENDPNRLSHIARTMASQIKDRVTQRQAISHVPAETAVSAVPVEPSNTEPSNS